jgi:nicotinate (nicotinamide) nucleotide adenylyltransferase
MKPSLGQVWRPFRAGSILTSLERGIHTGTDVLLCNLDEDRALSWDDLELFTKYVLQRFNYYLQNYDKKTMRDCRKNLISVALFTTLALAGLLSESAQVESAEILPQTIVVYSGTFAPPHEGHVETAKKAAALFHADRVYIIPNVTSDHKAGVSSYELRKEMSQIAFSRIPHVVVGDPNLEQVFAKDDMGGVLASIHSKNPQAKILLVMGADSYPRFLSASENRLIPGVSVVINERKGIGFAGIENPGTPTIRVNLDAPGFSSSNIRAQIEKGESPKGVSTEVLDFIRKRKIYDHQGYESCLTRMILN